MSPFKADVEKGETKAQSKYTEYEYFFYKHKNKKFAEDAEVAVRAAVFVLFLALPFLLPRTQVEKFAPHVIDYIDRGWYGKYSIACFLFSYYKDLGNTTVNAITAVVGTFLAVVGIWILFGVFPEGVHEGAPLSLYVISFSYFGLFTWMMLWLNVPLNTSIFAISSFVWYLMAFMNPHGPRNFAKGFAIDLAGSATKEMVNALGGSLLALLCMCFPYPIRASKKVLDSSSVVTATLVSAWRDFSQYCCAETSEGMNRFDEARIKRELRDIQGLVHSLRANLDISWWECLGLGRVQRQRVMLYGLEDHLIQSFDRIQSLFSSIVYSLHENGPSPIMYRMLPHIDQVIEESGLLLRESLAAVGEDRVTPERKGRLRERVRLTRNAVKQLTDAFRDLKQSLRPKPKHLDVSLLPEHAFCLSVCAFGDGCSAWGMELIQGVENHDDSGFLGLRSLKSVIDEKVLFHSADHLNWVIRNWVGLCVSFGIGYYGTISSLPLTRPYNASISSIMAVLLSDPTKGVSTGVSKNMMRLQGVILGTAVGSKVYSIFAMDCSWFGMGALMVAVLFWMTWTFFIYHNSATNSYFAFLLGYAGTMGMISGCGLVTGFDVASTIMDLLMTIVIMAMLDILFEKETAASRAHSALVKAWASIKNAIDELLDSSVPDIRFHQGRILGELSHAESLGVLAEEEARWGRTPWRAKTFNDALDAATRIRYILTGMKCAAAGGTQAVEKPAAMRALMQLEGWEPAAQRPIFKMQQVQDMFVILRHEVDGVCEEYQRAETEVKRSFRHVFEDLLYKVVDDANRDPLLMVAASEAESETLEGDPASRQSYLVVSLRAIIEECRLVQSQIMFDR